MLTDGGGPLVDIVVRDEAGLAALREGVLFEVPEFLCDALLAHRVCLTWLGGHGGRAGERGRRERDGVAKEGARGGDEGTRVEGVVSERGWRGCWCKSRSVRNRVARRSRTKDRPSRPHPCRLSGSP